MGVCTIGLKAWNKDGYGRREYVQSEMYNLKLKWAIGKMKWYTVDIKNSCFSTILSVIIGRDKYISVLFFKCELGAVMKGRQSRHSVVHFRLLTTQMHIDVDITLYLEMTHVTATVLKMRFVGSNVSFQFSHRMFLFTPWLIGISSHCLAALPATDVCFQQSQAAKRLLP